ncbi:uncharacterized protein TNCV_834211 [Trichonephila clavipes]|nr:uncharacterized protein TNCV_834211 [Trichonephila clavipes]
MSKGYVASVVSRNFDRWQNDLAQFQPNLEGEHSRGGQRPPDSFPFPPTLGEDFRLDGYLEYLNAAPALYIYKHPCLLRDSNPVPTAQ